MLREQELGLTRLVATGEHCVGTQVLDIEACQDEIKYTARDPCFDKQVASILFSTCLRLHSSSS